MVFLPTPTDQKPPYWQGTSTVGSSRRSMFPNQHSRSQQSELGPQSIDCGLDNLGNTWDRQRFVKELVQSCHRGADQTCQHLALTVRQLREHAADFVDLRRSCLQSRQSSLRRSCIGNAVKG